METKRPALPRGRPRTITRERIANAGIALGLPKITIVGIAAKLGISHMALYKHVPSLDALKRLVAEEIFLRWRLPQPEDEGCGTLEAYLPKFSLSLWTLIDAHPGLAPYLLRRDMITPAMTAKIAEHQERCARAYQISRSQALWLLFTVAYHCVAVADTVRLDGDAAPGGEAAQPGRRPDAIDPEYALGIRALITGALALLDEVESDFAERYG